MLSSIISFVITLGIAYYVFLLSEKQDNGSHSKKNSCTH